VQYHVYRYSNGCKWMEDLQEAADYFKNLPTDGKYASIGLTEGSYAVDVVIKGAYAEGQAFLISQDIKQSKLFKENPEKIIHELSLLYQAVGIDVDRSNQILSDLRSLADELEDDLEEL